MHGHDYETQTTNSLLLEDFLKTVKQVNEDYLGKADLIRWLVIGGFAFGDWIERDTTVSTKFQIQNGTQRRVEYWFCLFPSGLFHVQCSFIGANGPIRFNIRYVFLNSGKGLFIAVAYNA